MKHEQVLFGNLSEMTAEEIARGEGGGLIALVRTSREVSEKNQVLLKRTLSLARIAVMISGASLASRVPWKAVAEAVAKLFS